MQLIVDLIVGLAWPVAIVWIAYLFKHELRGVLGRVSLLKYKNVEAKFELGLAQAEAKVAEIDIKGTDSPAPAEISSKLESLRRIADVSPRAAILEAWILIEDAAGQSGFVQGASHPPSERFPVRRRTGSLR